MAIIKFKHKETKKVEKYDENFHMDKIEELRENSDYKELIQT